MESRRHFDSIRSEGRSRIVGVAALFLLGALPVSVLASGTYVPPPSPEQRGLSAADVRRGNELFNGAKPPGSATRSCASCHDAGAPQELNRSSLKRRSAELLPEINECLASPERAGGGPLARGSLEAIQLGTYLISRFRLSARDLDQFK